MTTLQEIENLAAALDQLAEDAGSVYEQARDASDNAADSRGEPQLWRDAADADERAEESAQAIAAALHQLDTATRQIRWPAMTAGQLERLIEHGRQEKESQKKRIQRLSMYVGCGERTMYSYLKKGTSPGAANQQLWQMAWRNYTDVIKWVPLTNEQRTTIEGNTQPNDDNQGDTQPDDGYVFVSSSTIGPPTMVEPTTQH